MILLKLITVVFLMHESRAKILRNNALINKMMSNFQNANSMVERETTPSKEAEEFQEPEVKDEKRVLTMMQSVLCRNFPMIPCNLIVQDDTLRKLMERSIQQISYKKMNIERSTTAPGYGLTLFPVINSEDLSSFLSVKHSGIFRSNRPTSKLNRKKPDQKTIKNFWSHGDQPKNKIKAIKKNIPELYKGMNNIRKFYPHKIKHKEKNDKSRKTDFMDYSGEKLSMSVEVPDMQSLNRKNLYKANVEDPPVWRIDYMKHGEPSLNMFAYEDDRLRGKIMQTGPSVIVDENMLEQAARREVLHPDVYIKKKFMRRGSPASAEGID